MTEQHPTMNISAQGPQPRFVRDVLMPMLLQEFRRLRASVGNFLTTSVATAVVLALFAYIFGDFFKEKLPQIDPELAARSLNALIYAVTIIFSLVIAHHVAAKISAPDNWMGLIWHWGVSNAQIAIYRRRIAAVMNGLLMLCCALLLNSILAKLSVTQWLVVVVSTVIAVLRFDSRKVSARKQATETPSSSLDFGAPPLIAWRKSRLAQPSWPGSSLKFMSTIPIVLGTIANLRGQAHELTYLSSLAGGILLSWIVPLLIDDDLKTAWIERQAAISHGDWIDAWQKIFTGWALRVFTATLIGYGLTALAGITMKMIAFHQSIFTMILINALLTAFPLWIAPAFVMQIDGKKPLTNIVMLTLIGIFAGSAIIAIPWVAPFIYLLHREAHRYQGGRFARGAYH